MSLVREQAAFLRDFCKLVAYAGERGFILTGGELERKPEMQEIYVRSGRSQTMDSMHLRKCAIDLNIFVEQGGKLELIYDIERIKPLGDYWEALSPANRWGGNWRTFKDIPHFERNLGPLPVKGSTAQNQPPSVPPSQGGSVNVAAVGPAATPASGVFTTIRQGSTDERSVVLAQAALQKLGYLDAVDGDFGPRTDGAIRRFQQEQGLVSDGVLGLKSWTKLVSLTADLFAEISGKWLGSADLDAAAAGLNVEPAAIKAVYEIEAQGSGFLGLRPKILFEGHIFWQQLQARNIDPAAQVAGNEDILFEKRTNRYYSGGSRQWERLERAMRIDKVAALESASYGLFQIMGNNWQMLGYADVEAFVAAMAKSEREHLDAFCRFVSRKSVKGMPLVEFLRNRQWEQFAYGYNGAAYRDNQYDTKLAAAYVRNLGRG